MAAKWLGRTEPGGQLARSREECRPQGAALHETDLPLAAAEVVAVAVLGPNPAVGAVDDQLAAVAGSLRAGNGDGLGLRGLDDGGALSTGRDNGEAVGAGGYVDVLRHDWG